MVSVDPFNQTALGLVVIVPLTSKAKGLPLHVRLDPPEGGLQLTGYAKCEDVRSVSREPRASPSAGRPPP